MAVVCQNLIPRLVPLREAADEHCPSACRCSTIKGLEYPACPRNLVSPWSAALQGAVPTEKSVRASPADSHREHPRTVGRSRRRCCKPCCHRSVLRPTLICPPCCPPSRPRSAPCSANAPTSFWRTSPCASSSRSSPGGGPGRGSP